MSFYITAPLPPPTHRGSEQIMFSSKMNAPQTQAAESFCFDGPFC